MNTLQEPRKKGRTKKKVGKRNHKDGWDCLWEGRHGTGPVEEDE